MTKRRKPLQSMSMKRSFLCWAVLDSTGQCKAWGNDVRGNRYEARNLLKARKSIAFPIHPSAQWRVVRVEVRVISELPE